MKYIDAEKLLAEIERRMEKCADIAADERNEEVAEYYRGKEVAYDETSTLITSHQQEQPEVQNGKFVFPKYLYARTKDNKTIDMSYAPQDMTAIEYIRNDFVEPEVDLNKEIEMYISSSGLADYAFLVPSIARHFYERGLNARKEE